SLIQDLIILDFNHSRHSIQIIFPYSFWTKIYSAPKSFEFSTSGALIKFNSCQNWIQNQIFQIFTFILKSPDLSKSCVILNYLEWLSHDLYILTGSPYLPPPEPPDL